MTLARTRWAAIGAAVAVTLGGGGIAMVSATSPADAVTFVPITPCRVIDTRPADEFNVGPKSSPVGPGEEHAVTAVGNTGKCTAVPAEATAVSLNVTALNATLPTFIAVYATGETTPDASSLNPQPGAPPTPNAVTTELSAGGEFTIFNKQGSVDVLADINGYYTDHHHDDRYYTKDESDDRYYTTSQSDDRFLQPGEAAPAATTQTRWAGCNGPSMNAANNVEDTFIINNNTRGYVGSTATGTRWYCELNLPQGAQMNRFRALLRDTGPAGGGQGLSRCLLYQMPLTGAGAGNEEIVVSTGVGTGTVGTGGAETPFLLEDPMGSVAVDNTANVYFIKCDIFSGGTTTASQLGIYAAQVRYNIAVVPGTG